ncbi:hypothetical protein RND71_038020 [Anisodus tanguticus]|uniref:HMA domain-containing protein n=1 Tax=Anisodus tanguticus TaxID=243964 RepID=A0AAE1UYT0_9SOLA|nr:hypothetical protein RND71_038020 [Anisodus tanguticus]
MKQKVVIKLSLNGNDQKCRSKAFKIAVSQPGVESAAIKGDDKNQLEVVGDIDAACLTSLLRKKFGQADLVSVGPAGGGEKKDEKAGSDTKLMTLQQAPLYHYMSYPPQYPVYQVTDSYDQQGCSIM